MYLLFKPQQFVVVQMMFKYLKIICIQFKSETVSLFTEMIQLRSMWSYLHLYMRFFFIMKIGFKGEDLLIGQLFPIQIAVLSFQGRRMNYENVLISGFLICTHPLPLC